MASNDDHPVSRMTLGVYRLRPDGTRVVLRPTAPVEPVVDPPFGLAPGYPACACPRHARQGRR